METNEEKSVELNESNENKLLQLQELVAQDDKGLVTEFFEPKSDTEIAYLIDSFPPKEREQIWQDVPTEIKVNSRILIQYPTLLFKHYFLLLYHKACRPF